MRVPWDQALELISSEMKRVYRSYGPSAMFGKSYGWASTGKVNSANTLLRRLLNLCGGYVYCVNSYSTAAISTILPYVVGETDPRSTDWESVLDHSERVVFWGCDPLVTNDVDWFTTLHTASGYFKDLKKKKIKTYDINPIYSRTGQYLESEWIAPNPGGDCALMLGMIYELVSSGKSDKHFLSKCVSGYEQFLAYVLGETDGIPKTPAWASAASGISEGEIKALAHDLSDHRTMLVMGWGLQRTQFGEQPHWMGYALACFLGQIGLPGGGIGTNYHYSGGGVPRAKGPLLRGITDNVQPVLDFKKEWKGSRVIPVARFVDCFLNPGKEINFNGEKVIYPEIKMVMWAGGNPFAHQPDTNNLKKAWLKPETVVVIDTVWTATAQNADIVLPAATFFERPDISPIGVYTNDGIVSMKQLISPLGEARSDYQIFSALAEKLGCGQAFTEGQNEMDRIRSLYEEAREQGISNGYHLPDFEEFWDKGYVLYDRDLSEPPYIAFEKFREDPIAHPLKTESGLIQLFSKKIASYGYKDCLGHPAYFEPSEGLTTKNKEYLLAYLCGKSHRRLHSQLDSCREDTDLEPILMHPEDAAQRNIKDGDIVLVKNSRGVLLAQAKVIQNIRKHVVYLSHGSWYSAVKTPDGMVIDVHSNANTLTMDIPTSSLANGNIASSGLVEVELFDKKIPVAEPVA